jgi:DNA-binding protein H-NS
MKKMKTLEELQPMQAELNAQIALALEQANQLKKKQELARQAEITECINKIARAMNQYRLSPAHIFKNTKQRQLGSPTTGHRDDK